MKRITHLHKQYSINIKLLIYEHKNWKMFDFVVFD